MPEWSGVQPVVASIASLGSLNRMQGMTAHAVAPANAPVLQDQPNARQPVATPLRSASSVALAPAAMAALIEAQEHLAHGAPARVCERTIEKIDHLISRVAEGRLNPAAPLAEGAATLRRLETARLQLSQSFAGIQA